MTLTLKNGRLVRVPDRPITDCSGCGACCRHMGTPPGYAAFFGTDTPPDWFVGTSDYERCKTIPPEIGESLRQYYRDVKAGLLMDRTADFELSNGKIIDAVKKGRLKLAKTLLAEAAEHPVIPCLWYDEEAKQCRHHEYRPDTCREFEVGGDACRATRSHFRIPLPLA